MQIQWYPGHMAKAKRLLTDQLRRVDVVVELCDARLPRSSRNPDLETLAGGKQRILFLNKADLADEAATQAWLSAFQREGVQAAPFVSVRGRASDAVRRIESAARAVVERYAARGVKKTVRAMVVGVPNVGKSTFINRLHGGSIAAVGDRPGVTRAQQWVKISPYLELLDTPGLLWPRLNDQEAAVRLAYLGTIRDVIIDQQELAMRLLETLMALRPQAVMERFKLKDPPAAGIGLVEAICRGRGFLLSGGRCDVERAAAVVLDEFRAGKLGRITLEAVQEEAHARP